MRRNYWVVVASVLVLGVLTGCSDNLVAPSAAPSAGPVSAMLAPADRPSLSLSGHRALNGTTSFTVNPSGGMFFVGNHALYFPANSICDPATSSYGPAEWDAPCDPIGRPLTITATVRTVDGVSAVDFSPEIRFVPSGNAARSVWIFMYTPEARHARNISRFSIMFAETLGATPVDDAAHDPMLRTYVDRRLGISSRRIKHFTGYVVNSGYSCDPAATDCTGTQPETPPTTIP
jgi:hypothetical protein